MSRNCHNRPTLLLSLLCALGLASVSQAEVTIDSFEQGGFSFTAGTSVASETQTALFPPLTIGGQRVVSIVALAGGETVSAELLVTPTDDAVVFQSDPSGGSFSLGYGDFGLPTLDLTDGGNADRIEVVVTQADDAATLELELLDASSGSAAPSQPISGPGTYTFLFSSMPGVDLGDVRILQVDLETSASGQFSIAEVIATGPAPVPLLRAPGTLAAILALMAGASIGYRRAATAPRHS